MFGKKSSNLAASDVLAALKGVKDPEIGRDLVGRLLALLEKPGRGDLRHAADPPRLVHRQRTDHDAVEQHPPAGAEHAAFQRQQAGPIHRQLAALHGFDQDAGGLGRVTWLRPVSAVVLLAPRSGRLGIVGDVGRGLFQRAAGELRAESSGLDDHDLDAERPDFLAQGIRQALDSELGGRVVA